MPESRDQAQARWLAAQRTSGRCSGLDHYNITVEVTAFLLAWREANATYREEVLAIVYAAMPSAAGHLRRIIDLGTAVPALRERKEK